MKLEFVYIKQWWRGVCFLLAHVNHERPEHDYILRTRSFLLCDSKVFKVIGTHCLNMAALISAIILTFHLIGTEQSLFCLKQMYCTLFTLFEDVFYFLWLGYTRLNSRNTGKCKYIRTWPCSKLKSSTNIKEVNVKGEECLISL